MVSELVFQYLPHLKAAIEAGQYIPVFSQGTALGLLRDAATGQFASISRAVAPAMQILTSAGLPINPLSAIMAGANVVQNFGMAWQLQNIQSALASMQTTLGWIGAGTGVTIALQAVNIYQTYRLHQAVKRGFAEMHEGFLVLNSRLDRLESLINWRFDEVFARLDEQELRMAATRFETALRRIRRAQSASSKESAVQELIQVREELYSILNTYEERRRRSDLAAVAKMRYLACSLLVRTVLADVLFMIGERRNAADVTEESQSTVADAVPRYLASCTPFEMAFFALPEAEKFKQDVAMLQLLCQRYSCEELPSPVLEPAMYKRIEIDHGELEEIPVERFETEGRPSKYGVPPLPDFATAVRVADESGDVVGARIADVDDYKNVQAAFGIPINKPSFINLHHLGPKVGLPEGAIRSAASAAEPDRLALVRTAVSLARPDVRARLTAYGEILASPQRAARVMDQLGPTAGDQQTRDPWLLAQAAAEAKIAPWPDQVQVSPTQLFLGGVGYTKMAKTDEANEHGARVYAVAFSPLGQFLASAGRDNKVILRTLNSQGKLQFIGEAKTEDDTHTVQYSPCGRYLAYGDEDGNIYLDDGDAPHVNKPGSVVSSLGVSSWASRPSSPSSAAGLKDAGGPPHVYNAGSIVWSLAFHPSSKALAAGLKDNRVLLMSIGGRPVMQPITEFGTANDVNGVAFANQGRNLVFVDDDGYLHIAEIGGDVMAATASARRSHRLSSTWIRCVAAHPSRPIVATGGKDESVRVVDIEKAPRQIAELGRGDTVNSVAFTPCGKYVVFGDDDGKLGIWDWASKDVVYDALNSAADQYVYGVAVSPDGTTIATASYDEVVRVWRAVE
jgi:WD40 repeat protein